MKKSQLRQIIQEEIKEVLDAFGSLGVDWGDPVASRQRRDDVDVRYSIDYEKDIGGGEYENDTKTFTSKSEAESFAEEHYGVIEYEKYSGDERVEYGYVSNTGQLVPETNRRY